MSLFTTFLLNTEINKLLVNKELFIEDKSFLQVL